MCGIIGYLGKRQAAPLLLEGLKRLEYRGYDSAGVCVLLPNGSFGIVREVGKLERLSQKLQREPVSGNVGVGHTRWSTHGAPSQENAHPHTDCRGELVLVHNGIIENYQEIKKKLLGRGHRFQSQTDTEVLAHLLEEEIQRRRGAWNAEAFILTAVRRALKSVRGAYALVVLAKAWPGKIVGVRKDCPLVLGKTKGEVILASDIPALLPFTREIVFIEDNEIAILKQDAYNLYHLNGRGIKRQPVTVPWDPLMAAKDGHKHFMHKEIHEGPIAFEDTLRGRSHEENLCDLLKEASLTEAAVRQMRAVQISACGTAFYAGLTGEYLFEHLAHLSTHAEIASEFRYRSCPIEAGTLAIAISQSGETADTLAALRVLRGRCRRLGIVNQIGSTLTREADGTIYTRCGPEIGVASTKAFLGQLAVLYLAALAFGRVRGVLSRAEFNDLSDELLHMPAHIRWVLKNLEPPIQDLARAFQNAGSFLYFGRHLMYPIALEGALKLKEISYIHAEGYAAGEMKHGPIALIDKNMPVFAFAPKTSRVYEKVVSNLEEAYARGAKIIAITSRGDKILDRLAYKTLTLPRLKHEWFEPVLGVVCAQLFAYHVANLKGLDVDQPRNLAKSVTVE